jgi:hypothetical protein
MSRGSSSPDAVQLDLFVGRGSADDARSGKDRRSAQTSGPRPGSWPAFTRALAETLAVLEDKQYLILERKPPGPYVQVAAQDDGGLRIEAASNHYLEGDERLDRVRIRRLRQLGWLAPTYAPDKPKLKKRERKGSPNYYRDLGGEVDYAAVAQLLVATLREVYKVRWPSRLAYKAFETPARVILLPTLGIDLEPRSAERSEQPAPRRPKSAEELGAAVLAALKEWTGDPNLELDDDGGLTLSRREVSVFVRVSAKAPVVDLFSTVLRGAQPSLELLEALNEINNARRFVALSLMDSSIVACVSVDASPFVPEILTRALTLVADAAEETRTELRQRFAGRIAFEDETAPRPGGTPEAMN